MTGRKLSNVRRFPFRSVGAVLICRDRDGSWLVLHGEHGWSHTSLRAASADAAWLGANTGLPIRRLSS